MLGCGMTPLPKPHPDGGRLEEFLADDRNYVSAWCQACDRQVVMGVWRAIRLAGPDIRVHALGRRLRCSGCGTRGVRVVVPTCLPSQPHPDPEPA